jgi:hypothetical protein
MDHLSWNLWYILSYTFFLLLSLSSLEFPLFVSWCTQ